MAVTSLFWICVIIVMPCVENLSRYLCDFILEVFVRLIYVCWDIHVCSSGVSLRGKASFVVVTCISYSLFNKNNIRVMGDFIHACCLSFGRCSEPPYLATINLIRPWYMWPSCPGSFKVWMSC